MKILITSEQRIAMKMPHKHSQDSLVRHRSRCVLLTADGWNTSMIAQSQLIYDKTVRNHLYEWLNDEKL